MKLQNKALMRYQIRVVVRNAWEARIILLRYMCEEKKKKTCPSWMLAVHGSQR
jgi:hypothetical protein